MESDKGVRRRWGRKMITVCSTGKLSVNVMVTSLITNSKFTIPVALWISTNDLWMSRNDLWITNDHVNWNRHKHYLHVQITQKFVIHNHMITMQSTLFTCNVLWHLNLHLYGNEPVNAYFRTSIILITLHYDKRHLRIIDSSYCRTQQQCWCCNDQNVQLQVATHHRYLNIKNNNNSS